MRQISVSKVFKLAVSAVEPVEQVLETDLYYLAAKILKAYQEKERKEFIA